MEIPPEILSDAEFDARELVARVQRLAPVLVAHRRAVAAELGIALRELVVLELLDRVGRMAVSALAERVGLSPSAASRLVDRLEERGLAWRLLAELDHDLRRLVDADGRPAHRATADLLADAADTAVRRTRALTDDPRWRHAVDTP